MKHIHMLCLFDYKSRTGYGTVSNNFIENWKRYFGNDLSMDIVAINYFGEPLEDKQNLIRVISGKKTDMGQDDFGRHVFLSSLRQNDYDLIFILQDLGVVLPMVKHLREINRQKKEANKKQFKSIYYFPVDFHLTPNLAVGLDYFDQLATFTEYGREQVLRLQPNVRSKLNVINHGSNPTDFYWENDSTEFRHKFFGENASKFIVTNVNRNQSRKDIPTTIFGFLEYWQEYNQNSFLYLHMHPEDPMGWNLKTILNQTVLQEGKDYMFLPEEYRAEGAPLEVLRGIYNASDVFLTTATGGGWELTVTEAMACGLPVIMPYHTSHLELGGANGERCWFLKTLYPTVAMVDNIIRYQCDLFEIAEKLDEVQKTIENAASGITSRQIEALRYVEKLSWGELAHRFSEHIKRLG